MVIYLYISDILTAQYTVSQEEVQLSSAHPIKVAHLNGIADVVSAHDHEFYEVVYISSGEAIHVTDAGEQQLSAGDLLILAPGQVHAIRNPVRLSLFNTYYLSEWLLQDLPLRDEAPELCLLFLGQGLFPYKASASPIHVALSTNCGEQVAAELNLLAQLSQLTSPNTVLMRATLIKTFALVTDTLASSLKLEYQFLAHPIVRNTMERIDRSLANGEPCNVAEWAQSLNYTPEHFSRRFRQLTGERPTTFYQRRRLQLASQALIRGNEQMSTIAHSLGFTDSAHFSRVFREHYQMPPLAYRKRFSPTVGEST